MVGMDEIVADAMLFDLDGTLVDSFELSARWWQRWAQQTGLDWDAIAGHVRGRTAREALRDLLPDRPDDHNDADAASLAHWEETNVHLMRATVGAADLLTGLPPDRWAVVTTSNRVQATTRLRAAGLPVPAVLVTADDIRNLKPDPEGYLLAATALGTKPADCVVIEDSTTGMRAGLAAGATVLAVGDGARAHEDVVRIRCLTDIRLTLDEADPALLIRLPHASR